MKCVVIGGNGFIGSYIVDLLAKEGHDIIIYDIKNPSCPLPHNVSYVHGDICYLQNLLHVISGAKEVYDTSGILGTSELNFDAARAIDINIKGAYNIIEACRLCKVKYVFTTSKPNQWRNMYSITKFAKEEIVHMYGELYNMNITVLCWFNATGPRQHLYPVRKAVPIFIIQAMRNRDLEIFGDGCQTVDIIYGGDVARITLEATRKLGHIHRTLDFGSGIPITVNELAEKIIKFTGSKSQKKHINMRIGEPLKSNIVANLDSIKQYLDINSLTDIDTVLKLTIDYYRTLPTYEIDFALDYFDKLGKNDLGRPL